MLSFNETVSGRAGEQCKGPEVFEKAQGKESDCSAGRSGSVGRG